MVRDFGRRGVREILVLPDVQTRQARGNPVRGVLPADAEDRADERFEFGTCFIVAVNVFAWGWDLFLWIVGA